MLLGRGAELERVSTLLEGARRTRGGALVVRGDAGIGKSALLSAAREAATDALMLSVTAVEAESNLPYAGLAALLGPLTGGLSQLPGAQSAALAGALALGPAIPGDRLAVCVATYHLLEISGSAGIVLALVDDAQWLDTPSRECISYAASRLDGTRTAMLIAFRDDPGWPDVANLPHLRLGPLSTDAARALLARSVRMPESVQDGVLAAAAGNPLVLLELPGSLEPDERTGRVPLPDPFRPGTALGHLFGPRIARLSPEARIALLVASATGTDDLPTIWSACRSLGIDADALESAESEGLVTLEGAKVRFRHPLVRGTSYHEAEPALRRRVHRALAEVTDGDRRAWHLASGATGPDSRAAEALDQAAREASGRRAYATAALAFARAAELSEPPEERAARLYAAGASAFAAGRLELALGYLEDSAERSRDRLSKARAHHLWGMVAFWGSSGLGPAVEHLTMAADLAAGLDPWAAASAYADLSLAHTVAADCRAALAAAERAAAMIDEQAPPQTRALVGAAFGWALALRGQTPRARAVLAEVEPLLPFLDPLSPEALSILLALNCRLPFGDLEGAIAQASGMVDAAREAGALGALPFPLSVLGDLLYRVGDWHGAGIALDEAVALADETGQDHSVGLSLALRARIHAARGSEIDAWADIGRCGAVVERSGRDSGTTYGEAAAGFLELGLGRIDAALVHLQEVERLAARTGLDEPSLIPWAPDSIETHVRAGRIDDALRVLAILERQAGQTGSRWAAAALERCRGIIADNDFELHFASSLGLHDGLPMPFERGRTILSYGERLHRARRRIEARKLLREALDLFEGLGAEPWAARARAELRAAGGIRRPRSVRNPDELTEQEARVARVVAGGASNHEVAVELFLSEKTVEYHLAHVFRKLGINRRSQLAALAAHDGIASRH